MASIGQILPPCILSQEALDLSELTELNPALANTRDRLEAVLECHVAAYRVGAKGRQSGLCDVYQSAELSENQLRSRQS